MQMRHHLQFPPTNGKDLGQDEVFFYVRDAEKTVKLRFHDYASIYDRRGLYEQLFYDRLKCASPKKVSTMLAKTLDSVGQSLTERRVLDLGAGNGMMGEALKQYGVARLVGADIIPEARDAAYRDRPGLYDAYYVEDFCNLSPSTTEELKSWNIDCFTTVAALGFGDIPTSAFLSALNLVELGGWVAFNIKETFLDESDTSGFSRLIRELIFSECIDLYHLEKYRHRLSIDGTPLWYFALVGQKSAEIPPDFLKRKEIE